MKRQAALIVAVGVGALMFRTLQSFTLSAFTPNVRAFLALIRKLESNNDYGALVFGGRFSSFATHPNIKKTATINGRSVTSTAAGAYQFLKRTYDWLHALGVMPDMSPASQDAGAVFLLKTSGALALISKGDFAGAVKRASLTWASLPGSPYGQNAATYARALAIYKKEGGQIVA